MNILFIGDVVGRPGRTVLRASLSGLCAQYGIDFVVANTENAAGGVGVTPDILDELLAAGVHAFTLGNHTWRKKQLAPALERYPQVVRPANFADGVPGRGGALVSLPDGRRVGVVNVVGRVYMEPAQCPFAAADREVDALRRETPLVLVDIHAEATSEKVAMGWYLDGRCTAVVGTHTHVQTADERVLPGGTAYITDVGMTGPRDSVIGVERKLVLRRFLTGMPVDFEIAKDAPMLNGVVIEADDETGLARRIARVQFLTGV